VAECTEGGNGRLAAQGVVVTGCDAHQGADGTVGAVDAFACSPAGDLDDRRVGIGQEVGQPGDAGRPLSRQVGDDLEGPAADGL